MKSKLDKYEKKLIVNDTSQKFILTLFEQFFLYMNEINMSEQGCSPKEIEYFNLKLKDSEMYINSKELIFEWAITSNK